MGSGGRLPCEEGECRESAVKGGLTGLAAALVAGVIAGCGGSSGPPTLSWYIFPEPSGSFAHAAQVCSQASGGKYKIALNTLPTDADGQRQELVRRLAAKDSSIDIIGMDVTYTPEFAEAGWLRPWVGANRLAASKGMLPGPLATATWKGTIFGMPDNSNTQLLWYRKDLVPNPPTTWAQMIQDAVKLAKEGKPHYIEVQGKQYEGLTVWFNTLVASQGGSILKGPTTVSVGPTAQKAATIIHDVATSPGADPSLSNSDEGTARLAFESGSAAFELNYPFVYPSIQADDPKLAKQMGWTYYPSVNPGKRGQGDDRRVQPRRLELLEVPAVRLCGDQVPDRYRPTRRSTRSRAACRPRSAALYNDPALAKPYPFKALIAKQLATAGIRPQTPAYADVTIAIQKALSPPSIDRPHVRP